MTDFPERVWLPMSTAETGESLKEAAGNEGICEYVRSDIHEAAIAELQNDRHSRKLGADR